MTPLLLLLLFGASPSDLDSRDYATRDRATRALSHPVAALLVALSPPPATPEAKWRRSRIVGDGLIRPVLDRVQAPDVTLALLATDPTLILLDPHRICAMIDARGLFWSADSYAWASYPGAWPTWKLSDDLTTVAREAARRWKEGSPCDGR